MNWIRLSSTMSHSWCSLITRIFSSDAFMDVLIISPSVVSGNAHACNRCFKSALTVANSLLMPSMFFSLLSLSLSNSAIADFLSILRLMFFSLASFLA